MPMSPLPNFAGGRPLPFAAAAPAGVSAESRAPEPITAAPPRPAFLRNARRLSPSSSASTASWWVSARASSWSNCESSLWELIRLPPDGELVMDGGCCRSLREADMNGSKSLSIGLTEPSVAGRAQGCNESLTCAYTSSYGRDPRGMDLITLDSFSGETVTPMAAARVVRSVGELRAALLPQRHDGRTVGLVPTMGFLHEGHVSLLRAARAENDVVVMSLFVNPTQFGPGEDLDRYPRDEERDLRLATEAGTDIVFAPVVAELYPEGF